MLDLTAGKYIKFNFEHQFSFLRKVNEIDMSKLEKLYKMAMKFKQTGFVLFERELNFSKVMRDMGIFSMFDGYVKAVCVINANYYRKGSRKQTVERGKEKDKSDDEEMVREILKRVPYFN